MNKCVHLVDYQTMHGSFNHLLLVGSNPKFCQAIARASQLKGFIKPNAIGGGFCPLTSGPQGKVSADNKNKWILDLAI